MITVEKALQELIDAGAEIEKVGKKKFKVTDNGFWGLCEQNDPFIVDDTELLEMHEMYIGDDE